MRDLSLISLFPLSLSLFHQIKGIKDWDALSIEHSYVLVKGYQGIVIEMKRLSWIVFKLV